MCGTPDYHSLALLAERLVFFGFAAVTAVFGYKMLSSVRDRDMSRLQRSLKQFLSYFRLR